MEAATATSAADIATLDAGVTDRLRSDTRLVERFRQGDDAAFAALYRRHRRRVLAVCAGVLGSADDAQDASQEAFARAARGLRSDSPQNVGAWLARVARNAAIDVARRRQPPASELTAEPVVGGDEGRTAAVRDLVVALRALPEGQRIALVMRELGGFTYAEIGGVLGVDSDAVNGLIARARIGLRAREEAVGLGCGDVRERLTAEADGRRRPAELRRHLRACDGCRAFQRGLRDDRRSLRAVLPGGGLGLWHLLVGWRASRAAVGGVAANGLFGSGAAKLAAVCALCAGAAGGVVPLAPGDGAERERGRGKVAGAAGSTAPDRTAATPEPVPPASARAWSITSLPLDLRRLERRVRIGLGDWRGAVPDGWSRGLAPTAAELDAAFEELRAAHLGPHAPPAPAAPPAPDEPEPAPAGGHSPPAEDWRQPPDGDEAEPGWQGPAWRDRGDAGVRIPDGVELPTLPRPPSLPQLPEVPRLPQLPDPGALQLP